MRIDDWQINSVAYDGKRRVLELEMNTRERYQFLGVPRSLAVGLVRAKSPAQFENEISARGFLSSGFGYRSAFPELVEEVVTALGLGV